MIGINDSVDKNATGAFLMALYNSETIHYLENIDLLEIKNFYVIWRNRKNILELSNSINLPQENINDLDIKINKIKDAILSNTYTDTTIFVMRPDSSKPIVIIDGIHRAIGIQKALLVKQEISERTCLRMLLFEGAKIADLEDYYLSVNK